MASEDTSGRYVALRVYALSDDLAVLKLRRFTNVTKAAGHENRGCASGVRVCRDGTGTT